MALYLDPVRSELEVLDKLEVDLSATRVYEMKGSFTKQDLLDTCNWSYGSGGHYKYLKVGLVTFDEYGEMIEEVPGRELIFYPKYIQKYHNEGEMKSPLGMFTLKYEIDVATEFRFNYHVE